MVASSDLGWIQWDFSTLVGLFDRVGLNANVGKTFGMVYRSCQVVGTQLEAGYKRWMTGAGPSYQERQHVWLHFIECGEDIELGSLAVYLQTQQRKEMGSRQHWGNTALGGEPCTYKMDFPTAGVPRNCPVKGCRGWAEMRMAMRVHFFHWHVRYTVIILEEINFPYPWCPQCNILVPRRDLNGWHLVTAQ